MVWASRIIKVNLEQEGLMKHSMSDNVILLTQPWLHRVSLKGIKINSEVKFMNFFSSNDFLNVKRLQLKLRLAELFRVVELARGRYSINKSTLYTQVLQGLKNIAKKGLYTYLFCQL